MATKATSTRTTARLRVARRSDGRWYVHKVKREFWAPRAGGRFWSEVAVPVAPGHATREGAMTAAATAMAGGDVVDIIVREEVRPGNPDDAPF